jgi:hypothetical protein
MRKTMAWKAYYKKDLTPPAGGAFYKHIAGLHDLNMLDDILNAVNEAREAEVQRLDKIERKREAARSAAANGHVLPSEPLKRTGQGARRVGGWPQVDVLAREEARGLREVDRRQVHARPSPHPNPWLREADCRQVHALLLRRHPHPHPHPHATSLVTCDRNEMLLEKGKKWFPMYAEMQTQVEQAFQSWQLALISDPKSKGRCAAGTPRLCAPPRQRALRYISLCAQSCPLIGWS